MIESSIKTGVEEQLLKALEAIEDLVSDDFCVEMDMRIGTTGYKLRGNAKIMQDKISRIYRIAHGFNTKHSCYRVHDDWRALPCGSRAG